MTSCDPCSSNLTEANVLVWVRTAVLVDGIPGVARKYRDSGANPEDTPNDSTGNYYFGCVRRR